MRHGPLDPPVGDRSGPSGPRTITGLVAFALLAAFLVAAALVPAVGIASIAAATAAGLGRALARRRDADRRPPADASTSDPRPQAD